jgi:predicted phosphodiesterase
MRIAVLADIHGNPIALDAVLADIEAQAGVDGYWLLGDLVALGYDPVGVLERLVRLPAAACVRGNTDRYIVTGDRPGPWPSEAEADASLVARVVEITGNFAWTQGALLATGWAGWLAALPVEQRVTLPDGTRVLLVHAAPGTDDGWGMRPNLSDAAAADLLAGCAADLVCVGHTHWPLDRRVGSVRVINPGGVSNPSPPDLRASYALLDADARGYAVSFRRVEYDRAAVIAEIDRVRHPAAGYLRDFMLGKRPAPWKTE